MSAEEKGKWDTAMKMWNEGGEKIKYKESLMRDVARKQKTCQEKRDNGELEKKRAEKAQIMADLHATYFDAKHMYDFLVDVATMQI